MTKEEKGEDEGERIITLTEVEHDLLVKACRRYRASIPAYLKSGERELVLLDDLLKKLS